ncbi:recombination protein NinB [Escherichia coli]
MTNTAKILNFGRGNFAGQERNVADLDDGYARLSNMLLEAYSGADLTKRQFKVLLGNGFVVIGQSTSRMRVGEFAELLELIQAFGTERGVKWSDEARLALEWKARWGDRAA